MPQIQSPLLRRAAYVLGRLRERSNFTFQGARFHVQPEVLNPTAFRASFDFAREVTTNLPAKAGRALDLGCGSGLLAVLLAKAGHEVTAVDVHDVAVHDTVDNAARNGVQLRALISDWDEALANDERFDFIVMNPPFLREEPPAFRKALFAGHELEVLHAGVRAVARRLAPGGQAMILTSDRTGDRAFQAMLEAVGLRVTRRRVIMRWNDEHSVHTLVGA